MLDPRWWRKRFAIAITLTSFLSGTLAALGGRVVWPGDAVRSAVKKGLEHDTALALTSARIGRLERNDSTKTYLICEVLRRVSPKGAVMPQDCK